MLRKYAIMLTRNEKNYEIFLVEIKIFLNHDFRKRV